MSPRSTRCFTGWSAKVWSRGAGSKRRASAGAGTTGSPRPGAKLSPNSAGRGANSWARSTGSRDFPMPDFSAYVRRHLPALHVSAERESEIVAELAQQLEQAYDDALAAGSSEADALQRAHSHLGDWTRLGCAIDVPERRPRAFDGLTGDARYALRFLWRNPVFAAVAVATLAFGIGGNTAVFTLTDTLLLRVLPYRAPDQLIAIDTIKTQQPEVEHWSSAGDFYDFRDRARSYSAIAGISPVWSVILTGRGPAEQLDSLYVSASLFPMLGVQPALGRLFTPEEDVRSKSTTIVILSHRFWQRLGGNRDLVGQKLQLDN